MFHSQISQSFKVSLAAFLLNGCFATSCFAHSEEYLEGYVRAVIHEAIPEQEISYYLNKDQLNLIVIGSELDPVTEDKLLTRLKESDYFSTINIRYSEDLNRVNSQKAIDASKVKTSNGTEKLEIIPNGVIYDTPVADPKWPQFAAGYQHHFQSVYGKKIFELAFGENLALLRYRTPQMVYELGAQAGLTGLMDFSNSPSRLVNSDYFIGLGLSIVYDKKWQNLVQLSHLSAHIGDEYIISRPGYLVKRVNLSYEALKWYTAYKSNSLRPYMGFGYLIHRDPSSLKPFTLEVGCDYISDQKIFWDKARYILGANAFFWQETKFSPRVNVSAGIQLDNPVWVGRKLKFLINYTNGNSRHGQFYKKREKYMGMSINISN